MNDPVERFDLQRRIHGPVLGALSGLIFGLISQGINYLAVSGVTFYQPPLGAFGNTLLFTLVGALLGLITAWAGGSAFGVMIGSLVAGLILIISALLSTDLSSNLGPKLAGLIGFYLPFAALVVPMLSLLRIAVNEQREWYELPFIAWRRVRLPLFLLIVMGALGVAWLFPRDGQIAVARMDQLIRAGLSAASPSELPAPLQARLVGSFPQNASPSYTLQLDLQNLIRYQIPYTPRARWSPSIVVARFHTGWSLACLYVSPDEDPFCKGYDDLSNQVR